MAIALSAALVDITTLAALERDPGSLERVIFACFNRAALEAYRAEGVETSA